MHEDALIAVLAHYDVGKLRRHERIRHGYVNDHWWVETNTGQYFLRRRHGSLGKPHLIEAQHELIKHLSDNGFPVANLINTPCKTTFVELENEIYELYHYISGDLCDVERPRHCGFAAHTLAWYHHAVAEFDHPVLHWPYERYGPTALAGIVGQILEDWRGQIGENLDLLVTRLVEHTGDLTARFEECAALPKLIIHGDYHAGNLIFQGDTVVGVVDFDLAHRDLRGMEVAEALIFFTTERSKRLSNIVYSGFLDLKEMQRFIEIYNATTRLTEGEIQALPHLIRTIWLCAALDPPLEPLMSIDRAPQALPEVLLLADWARAHADDIIGIGMVARA
jgi:homoserine kinase type II